jgi:hypothetical protein
VKVCPIRINGSSTGRPPIHVRMAQDVTKDQNNICLIGYRAIPRLLFLDRIGRRNRIIRAENRATTPPSLFGIERRIAYTHRKYHSGLICTGVTKGFASRKFSGSVNKFGANRMININLDKAKEYPSASLME